ncbi:MAG: transketolase C-terminal domain-containing protein, partial [Candidatus Levyibacteriota bacterium]
YAGSTSIATYLRFSRDKSPIMTTEDTPFATKKLQTFWVSDMPKVTIFAMGYMLFHALVAAKELEEEGIQTLVVNVATIKPFDVLDAVSLVSQTKAAVSVEDHQISGGLGGLLAETFAKHFQVPMEFVGLQDTFAESGKPVELLAKYNMDKHAIKDAVKKVLARI